MSVPPFSQYYPSENSMNRDQRHFYQFLEKNLVQGKYPSVDDQISYLFVFVYKVLARWNRKDFEHVYKVLLELVEAYYYENYFSEYCKLWSYDCLLLLDKYEEFLDLTEPVDPLRPRIDLGFRRNLRWPVFHHLRKEPGTLDLYDIVRNQHKPTSFTCKYPGIFKELLDEVFSEIAEKNGMIPWKVWTEWRSISAEKDDSLIITISGFYSETNDSLSIYLFHNDTLTPSWIDTNNPPYTTGYWSFPFPWEELIWKKNIDKDAKFTLKIEKDGLHWIGFEVGKPSLCLPSFSFHLTVDIN